MKIFLSVGSNYSEQQEAFVRAFEELLIQNGGEKLTIGRGMYRSIQPIAAVGAMMRTATRVLRREQGHYFI